MRVLLKIPTIDDIEQSNLIAPFNTDRHSLSFDALWSLEQGERADYLGKYVTVN